MTPPAPNRTPARWRRRAVVAAIVVALVAALAWWRRPVPVPPPPSAAVELADIEQIVLAAGIVQPRLKVDVGAQVTGQVRTLHVVLGQQVHKGDLLVSLDPELARNDVQQAEAQVLQQQAALDSRRIDLAQARVDLERQRRLLPQEATARVDAEAAENNVAKLEGDVRGLNAALGKLAVDLAKSRLNLGFTQITAPIDGDVVSIAVQEGQTVNAQQQSPVLLTLGKLDTVTIKAQVPEADITRVKVGQEASFVTLGDAEQRFHGQVRLIQPVPEKVNNANFYAVLFDVPNPHRALMSDMSVQVTLRTARVEKALAIPMAALGDKAPDGRFTVQVSVASAPAPGAAAASEATRSIRVGINDAVRVQVLDGLKAGERVVLAPMSPGSAAAPR